MRTLALPLAVLAVAACTTTKANVASESHEALPFIEDDYGRAVTVAKEKSLPIFVDIWAPW